MYKNKNKESFKRKRPRTPCHSSPLHGMRLAWSCGPRSSALAFLEPSLNNRKMRNRRPESCCVRLVPLRPVCIAPGSLLTLQYSLTECGGLKDIKKTAPCIWLQESEGNFPDPGAKSQELGAGWQSFGGQVSCAIENRAWNRDGESPSLNGRGQWADHVVRQEL